MQTRKLRARRRVWREALIAELTIGLQELGYKMSGTSIHDRVEIAEKHFGIIPPSRGELNSKRKHRIAKILLTMRGQLPASPVEEQTAKTFYESAEWRRVRYDTIVKLGGRCGACGRTAKDGIKINVDHIKPVKKYWEMRLEPSNLQVLCNECNHGKGNRDETDWRPGF